MGEIIFVRILNDKGKTYDSYTDYWSLVRLSGFKVCEISNVQIDSDNTYIISPSNGNIQAHLTNKKRRCKTILWHLERGTKPEIRDIYNETWVSDRAYHKTSGDPKCKFVIMGGHKGLAGEPAANKIYDFVHMAYIYGRREHILNVAFKNHRVAPIGWGAQRDFILANSRWGLCLHQDEFLWIEPLRYTLFACWKLPLITEPVLDPFPYKVYPFDQVSQATDWQTNYQNLTENYTFRKCVEGALQ